MQSTKYFKVLIQKQQISSVNSKTGHLQTPLITTQTMELPSTSDDQIAQFQAEYQAAFNAGSQDELEAAKCRWENFLLLAVSPLHACMHAACLGTVFGQTGITYKNASMAVCTVPVCMQVHLGTGGLAQSPRPSTTVNTAALPRQGP